MVDFRCALAISLMQQRRTGVNSQYVDVSMAAYETKTQYAEPWPWHFLRYGSPLHPVYLRPFA